MTDLAPRPTGTGLEEAETTRTERFLALVLGVFVFIGLIWAYVVPLDVDDEDARFFYRLGLVVVALGGSLLALDRLRRSRSRAVVPLMGTIGAATLLGIVMAADYLDLRTAGPVTLSLFGIAVTVAVIVRYQRWLALQLPERRARKHECPWCGYPTHDGVPHCEGCGRDVVGDCGSCHQPRRAGVRYCGACGSS
jgi:peptidoglycan/LPS O-acetylase OafA/YrhL